MSKKGKAERTRQEGERESHLKDLNRSMKSVKGSSDPWVMDPDLRLFRLLHSSWITSTLKVHRIREAAKK